MQRLGFVHDMLDVKVLILFVMSRAKTKRFFWLT